MASYFLGDKVMDWGFTLIALWMSFKIYNFLQETWTEFKDLNYSMEDWNIIKKVQFLGSIVILPTLVVMSLTGLASATKV